jgi:hypothetical protein
MGPDVGQIKDVDLLLLPSLLGLLLRHDLNLHGPRWEAIISTHSGLRLEIDLLSLLDRLVKILLSVIVRLGSSLVGGKVGSSLIRDQMELSVVPLSLIVDDLQGVAVVTVHESPS